MAKKSSTFGLAMMVGAAVGAVAGLFLAPKAGKELRKDAKALYNRLKNEDPKKVAKAVFGEVTAESEKLVKHVYEEAAVQLADLKKKYKTIDKEKYQNAVKNVVSSVRKDGSVPEGALKKLAAYLEADAKKLVAKPRKTAAKTVKNVKAAVKKVATRKKTTAKKA